jgi:regulatory protein
MDKSTLIKLRNYCAYQERCHSEVRTKLLELGVRGLDLENYIVHLIQEDFLNEERFAKIYAGSKFRVLKWGKIKITQALKQKNVSAYCIKKGMQEISDDDYEATIKKLIAAKSASIKGNIQLPSNKQKVLNYLLSKGYSFGDVMKQVNKMVE